VTDPDSPRALAHRRVRQGLAPACAAALALLPAPLPAQDATIRLSGFVRARSSAEVLRGAVLSVDSLAARAETNQDGYFVLTLSPGRHRLLVRAVGYAPLDTLITLGASRTQDFHLASRPIELEEIAVQGRTTTPDIDPMSPEMSVARLDLETIRLVPVVLGEADPIRSLTLLPGVSAVNDFATGLSVRGGSVDQNLILLDESTIYNPAHVFGFFSVFNADAIDDVKLYKGAIPSRYGGRLSSVLDIRQREGNANEFEGQATVGLLASRLAVEGPLPGRVGSFLVAGRRTYADLFLKLSSDPDLNQNVAYFYDLNAKANLRLGTTGTVMLSGYFGRDRFAIGDRFRASWGNASGTLRWNQAIGGRLFSKAVVTLSDYDYGIGFLGSGPAIDWTARINSLELKVDQTWYASAAHTVEFGAQATFLDLQPGRIRPVGDSPIVPTDLQPRSGAAPAAHVSHEARLGRAVTIRWGARLSAFRRTGPATVYRYAGGRPLRYDPALGRYERAAVVDSTRFAAGDLVASFTGLEPRVSAVVPLSAAASLKASWSRTRQYLQLVSNTNAPTPVDIWEPAGPYLAPQVADQVALGFATTLDRERYEVSAEVFHKRLRDIPDFIDGADLALNDRLETEIVQGTGRVAGLELYARKRGGRLAGWVSYTLSRAEQRVRGLGPDDPGINGGRHYPAPFDRRHDLSAVGVYRLSPRWSLGATFVLASGLPATLPVSGISTAGCCWPSTAPATAPGSRCTTAWTSARPGRGAGSSSSSACSTPTTASTPSRWASGRARPTRSGRKRWRPRSSAWCRP
jgi:hypothetical protein